MRFGKLSGLGLGVAFVGMQAVVPATAVAANLACGQTVTTSVTLSADIGPCPGDGLVVTGSGITLDLGGHTIRGMGDRTLDQVGVVVANSDGVTVMNGTVTRFAAGVSLQNTVNSTVRAIRALTNQGDGNFNHGDGVVLEGSGNNKVLDSEMAGNGPFSGVTMVDGSDGNLIKGNYIHDNTLVRAAPAQVAPRQENYGVRFDTGASNNVIDGNRIFNNGSHGVNASGFEHTGNVVKNNTILGNGHYGILEPGVEYTISNNRVVGNGFDQFEVPGQPKSTFDGILVFGNLGGGAGVVEGNILEGNAHDGLAMRTMGFSFFGEYHPPVVVEVRNNTSVRNGRNGLFVECDFFADQFPNHVCIPNPPPHEGQHITANRAFGNGGAEAGKTAWDLYDENIQPCDSNKWINNIGTTAKPPCTLTKSS